MKTEDIIFEVRIIHLILFSEAYHYVYSGKCVNLVLINQFNWSGNATPQKLDRIWEIGKLARFSHRAVKRTEDGHWNHEKQFCTCLIEVNMTQRYEEGLKKAPEWKVPNISKDNRDI